MRYVGGKARIAKELVAQIPICRPIVWEPFCGGLNTAEQFALRGQRVFCSDAHRPLISLYRAMQAGWVPPDHVSEDDYQVARNLPDTDPRKGFAGFGCSFGGKFFGGYARGDGDRNYALNAKRALTRQISLLRESIFNHLDFLKVEPGPCDWCIYADPPYASTQGYVSGPFDHELFWRRCEGWARYGVPVYVSEYTGNMIPIWSKVKKMHLAGGSNYQDRVENLYRVGSAA